MYKWYLPTLSEIIAVSEPNQEIRFGSTGERRVRAEREWQGAIAALNALLQQIIKEEADVACDDLSLTRGLVISGSLPVLSQPELVAHFSTWTFTNDALNGITWMPSQLLPSAEWQPEDKCRAAATLPLLPNDPLAAEQFCLVLTAGFSLVMALGDDSEGKPAFLFSFEPEVVWQSWRSLRSRLLLTGTPIIDKLDVLVEQFSPVVPDYRIAMQFNRLLLGHLPEPLDWENRNLAHQVEITLPSHLSSASPVPARSKTQASSWQQGVAQRQASQTRAVRNQDYDASLEKLTQGKTRADLELLQAIAHEVRTPLTTIRTLTRLLLKRKDLSPEVIKRLEIIDQECTAQIDRFSLIFRAVELETTTIKQPVAPLAAISLTQVFQQSVPRWQQQASLHNLTLEVAVPQKLPMVLADPTMLDQVLTGLIDRITHSLPPGSHIQMQVKLAGHQLKLQLQSQPPIEESPIECERNGKTVHTPILKSIGELLIFQPETGNLSLNLSVTKNLFQALGGKLIVRQRPQQGEEMTIFLPLETQIFET